VSSPGKAAWLRRARPVTPAQALALADPARVRTILAVKTHDQLGDLLVAAPALAALRARYPAARLVLITRPYLAPLAQRLPGPDAVWTLPSPRDVVRFVHVVQNVRTLAPDLAFVLNSVSRSGTADALAAWSRARCLIGRSVLGAGPTPLGVAPAAPDPVYDFDVPMAAASTRQVDRVLDLVRWAGAEATGPSRLTLTAEERAAGAQAIGEATRTWPAEAPRVGFHPAAANPAKCWPVDSFVELAARLAAGGAAPVVFDTPKEPGPAAALAGGLRARGLEAAWHAAGPLEGLLAPLAALDLVVCNDSGILHVAAALGVPTLSFHSLGRPEEWAPRSETAIALHAERIAEIAVDEAERAAARLLAGRT